MMNREQRRWKSRLHKTAISLLVAATLVTGGVGELYAEAAGPEGDLIIHGGGGGGGGGGAQGFDGSSGSGGGGGGGYVLYTGTTPHTVFFDSGGNGGGGVHHGGAGGAGRISGGGGGGGGGTDATTASGAVGGASGWHTGGSSGNDNYIGVGHAGGLGNPSTAPSPSGSLSFASVDVTQGDNGGYGVHNSMGAFGGNGGNGGNATVTASNNVTLNSLTLYGGEHGDNGGSAGAGMGGAGGTGGSATFTAATQRVDIRAITLNQPTNGGAVIFTADTLVSRLNDTFAMSGSPSVTINNFEFDLTGAGDLDTLLEVTGGALDLTGKTGTNFTFSGTPGALAIDNAITLISGVSGTVTANGLTLGSFTFDVATDGTDLVATVIAVPTTHTLTITAGTGGTITQGTSGQQAHNAVINIAASANANFSFSHWTTSNGGAFANANRATTTFSMPNNSTTVTAHFTYTGDFSGGDQGDRLPPPAQTFPCEYCGGICEDWINVFTDIEPENWYYCAVAFVHLNGLMVGTSTEPMLFSPNMELTRGMAVTVLYRMEGSPDISGLTNPFSDVEAGRYYTDAIMWAASVGIVNGYGSGRFGPGDNLTREQMAAVFMRYAQFANIDISVGEDTNILSYHDVAEISSWAISYMQWAAGAGILHYREEGYLNPYDEATRSEFAYALMMFATQQKQADIEMEE